MHSITLLKKGEKEMNQKVLLKEIKKSQRKKAREVKSNKTTIEQTKS